MPALCTVGYELATPPEFLEVLREQGIELLVDVRAAARSRRVGFAKTRLAANLEEAGIGYLHLPALGTPAEGRAHAKAGRPDAMKAIFREHLATDEAQGALDEVVRMVEAGRRLCLLCLEADPDHCHRSLVADVVADRVPVEIRHLHPGTSGAES